jgi:hypothetical protein
VIDSITTSEPTLSEMQEHTRRLLQAPNPYEAMILTGLQRKPLYQGTVPYVVRIARRRKNRAARVARRASFDQPGDQALEPNRDRWGRPFIKPLNGGEPEAYTRVSTLAKTLDDLNTLMDWKSRMVAKGMARRPDLIALASANGDDYKTMQGVIKDAMAAAEAGAAANTGTALHTFTELIDEGRDIAHAPAALQPHLQAYRTALAMGQLRPVMAEQFVVVDEIKVAGSFDRMFAMGNQAVVLSDLKTGKDPWKYGLALAVQLACYSRGSLYDIATGVRTPLPQINQDFGLLIALPAASTEPKASVHTVDLIKGWQAAQVAAWVRDIRKDKDLVQQWFATP